MNRYRLSATIIGTLLVLSANAIVIRHDRKDASYQALARGFKAYGDVVDAGSTLIAPRWLVTAGHVAREISPYTSVVTINSRQHRIDRVIFHPDYVKRRGGPKDLALLRLSKPAIGVEPVQLYRKGDEAGQTVTFIGRGQTGDGKTGPTGEDGRMRGATNKLERVTNSSVFFQFDAPGTATELEGISGPGDSGGPALVKVRGKWAIVGVSSANMGNGKGLCRYGTTEVYARISTEVAWIEKTMKESPESTPLWSVSVPFKAWPTNRQGEVAAALLNAYNSGDPNTMEDFSRAFRDPAVLQQRTPDQRARGYTALYRRTGAVTVVEYAVDVTGKMVALLKNAKGQYFQLSLYFLGSDQARFEGFYVGDATPPDKAKALAKNMH